MGETPPFLHKGGNMTDILKHISTYDTEEHLPFPTLEFIKDETGFDLFYESGSEVKAQAMIKTYTKAAWKALASLKTTETRNKLEYLIATNETYRRAFLDLVASFVNAIYHLGGIDFLKATPSVDTSRDLPLLVRNTIEGSVLSVERLHLIYTYRVGY